MSGVFTASPERKIHRSTSTSTNWSSEVENQLVSTETVLKSKFDQLEAKLTQSNQSFQL